MIVELYTNTVVSAASRLIVLSVLIMHTILYIFLPQPSGTAIASDTSQISSYDDYFVEKVLHMPDKTPDKESDDIKRAVQVVNVREFYTRICYKEPSPTIQIGKLSFPGFAVANISMLSLDVLSRPPKPKTA